MAPPCDGGPSQAESQDRRIPPTPVCRDEVGLTSWLGKPLHQPARREQAWVLRPFFWSRVVTGSLVAPEKGWDDARHEHARDELLMTIY